jgi:hypothetical protein
MKKAVILTGLAVLMAAAVFSALRRRSEPPRELPPAPVQQQYAPLAQMVAVPRRSGPPATYGPLQSIGLEACSTGPCPGGSVNEMLSAHGRIWGYIGNYRSFEDADTVETYRLLSSYLACVGLSRGDPAFCDYLPAAGSDSKGTVPLSKSPNYQCRKEYAEVSLPSYAAGVDKKEESCRTFLALGDVGLGAELTEKEFCSAAAAGLGNVCGGLAKFVPKGKEAACRRVFPASPSDCGSADCVARLRTYEAMKARSAEACPQGRSELCAAYLAKSDASCSAILAKLGATYCAALAKATKRANGYPGYSPDEVKAAVKEQENRRALEDAQRRENERIIKEHNAKIKQLIGK